MYYLGIIAYYWEITQSDNGFIAFDSELIASDSDFIASDTGFIASDIAFCASSSRRTDSIQIKKAPASLLRLF